MASFVVHCLSIRRAPGGGGVVGGIPHWKYGILLVGFWVILSSKRVELFFNK